MSEPLIIEGKKDPRLQDARRCPFCNSSFLVFQSGPETKLWHTPTWRVTCVACSTRGPVAKSHTQAVKQWNGVPIFGRATLDTHRAAEPVEAKPAPDVRPSGKPPGASSVPPPDPQRHP